MILYLQVCGAAYRKKVSDEDFRRRHTPDTTTFEGSDVALRTRAKRVISGGERMSYVMILVAEFLAIRPVSDDMHAYYDRRVELNQSVWTADWARRCVAEVRSLCVSEAVAQGSASRGWKLRGFPAEKLRSKQLNFRRVRLARPPMQ